MYSSDFFLAFYDTYLSFNPPVSEEGPLASHVIFYDFNYVRQIDLLNLQAFPI